MCTGKPHIHPDHPDYVPSVFLIEYKRNPCTPRHILNRDSDKAFDCSTVETDEEEKMREVEAEVLRKQAYLRKEGDILLAEFERQENQRLQAEWEHQELSEILRTYQE